eukprot:7988330-Pyramimonas_sp.AAC.1
MAGGLDFVVGGIAGGGAVFVVGGVAGGRGFVVGCAFALAPSASCDPPCSRRTASSYGESGITLNS